MILRIAGNRTLSSFDEKFICASETHEKYANFFIAKNSTGDGGFYSVYATLLS
jgi:hypothetical protein